MSGFGLDPVLLDLAIWNTSNQLLTYRPAGSRVKVRVPGSIPSMFQEFLAHSGYLRKAFGNSSNTVYHRRDGSNLNILVRSLTRKFQRILSNERSDGDHTVFITMFPFKKF